MAINKVADKYAATFLGIALEKKADAAVNDDMKLIARSVASVPQFAKILENPTINQDIKAKVVFAIFKDKVDKETVSYLEFLVKKGRIGILHDVAVSFSRLRDEKLGLLDVTVSAVVELTEEQKKEVTAFLEKKFNKKITVHGVIDEEILGGFVAEAGDTIIDASLKNKLRNVKSKLLNSTIPLN